MYPYPFWLKQFCELYMLSHIVFHLFVAFAAWAMPPPVATGVLEKVVEIWAPIVGVDHPVLAHDCFAGWISGLRGDLAQQKRLAGDAAPTPERLKEELATVIARHASWWHQVQEVAVHGPPSAYGVEWREMLLAVMTTGLSGPRYNALLQEAGTVEELLRKLDGAATAEPPPPCTQRLMGMPPGPDPPRGSSGRSSEESEASAHGIEEFTINDEGVGTEEAPPTPRPEPGPPKAAGASAGGSEWGAPRTERLLRWLDDRLASLPAVLAALFAGL